MRDDPVILHVFVADKNFAVYVICDDSEGYSICIQEHRHLHRLKRRSKLGDFH